MRPRSVSARRIAAGLCLAALVCLLVTAPVSVPVFDLAPGVAVGRAAVRISPVAETSVRRLLSVDAPAASPRAPPLA